MEKVTYVIELQDNNVIFTADGKVFFNRKNDYLTIQTRGMMQVVIIDEVDGRNESYFPCDSFSLRLSNGIYLVAITYNN